MNRKIIMVSVVMVAIPAVALAYWLFSPYFIDEAVDEDFQFTVQAAAPEESIPADSASEGAESEDAMPAVESAPEGESVALKLLTGQFADQDAVHQGSGQAHIFELPDGSHVLRFEDFRVTNGPDLHVLISHDGSAGNAIDLGELKGNVGNQNYDIPADVDVSTLDSVIIYCSPFRVTFSVAKLAPPAAQ